MILLVCGGRNFTDREFVNWTLERVDAKRFVMLVVHNGEPGAAELAEQWATARHINVARNPVLRKDLGPAAMPTCNQEMLDIFRPDGVVAFPGGAGTADMVRRAQEVGIPVYHPPYSTQPQESHQ